MGLLEQLKDLGGRLGLIQIVSTTAPAAPKKVPTRNVTLKELTTEILSSDLRGLSQMPAELAVDFGKIFEAAGLKTLPDGWTIERLAATLRDSRFAGLDRAATQKAILELLSANQAHVHDLIKDAMAKDHALESYETLARQKLDARERQRQQRLEQLERQIRELEGESASLKVQAEEAKNQWRQWHGKKVDYEKQMAWAIGFLVDGPVIDVDEGPA